MIWRLPHLLRGDTISHTLRFQALDSTLLLIEDLARDVIDGGHRRDRQVELVWKTHDASPCGALVLSRRLFKEVPKHSWKTRARFIGDEIMGTYLAWLKLDGRLDRLVRRR